MKKTALFVWCLIAICHLNAQESQDELSTAAANPIANLMSFPFQNNLNMNNGPHNRNVNVLNIQPVIPFADGKIITRTIFPLVRIPDFSQESGKLASGLSDIIFTAFYVPEIPGLTLGIGPVLELPTGGDKRGTEKWSAGPSVVALIQPKDWTFGLLMNNAWSFAGDSQADKVNHMLCNLFVVKQLGDGWYVNSAPIITADWTQKGEDRWIVPLGAGGGRLVMLGGKLPLNLQTQLYYNVVRPDFGPEWQWRLQAQILLPKSIFSKDN
ncbi:hypothetical protein [Carboxylicivirga taeanensis]|uniref:hypothetical protein n=1 Tax=Carboxylicivirga taeanensis TaxID=1416875 RepID=UPI003F6DE476